MTRRKRYRTSYLFPKPTIIQGVGSIMNIAGNHYHFHYTSSPEEADFKAIENDWGMVGNDILKASQKVEDELLEPQD